ncbi:multi-pass transmembrane protein [Cyclospora cayetanensis]|uniref:Multi-pass transmembrane protein n=1 Tax=Cyclospora cayetanensis TaxID=88456 RepID=A0A1D3CUG8_9EIME|nr:multi-pass transmembrane protein [Cyclospora cayetanensis]
MAQLLQPFSFEWQSVNGIEMAIAGRTSESIEDAFIAPPDNIQESRDAMEEVERRLLYDDFQRCGILPESLLNLSELLMRLRSSSRQYDEEMVQRIYAALSSYKGSRDAYTTGRVFIEAYMKRRRELVAVLESARGELDSAEMMLQQAETHLANLAVDPNAALAEDSKLTAQIASLHNLNQGSPSASDGDVFKVHLECQQQVIETAPARVEGGSCYFNEVFSFEIAVREGDLRICLVKVDPASGAEELVGDCSVLLEDLADQKKREIRTLYEQYLQEFTLRREAKIRELSDYQEELDKLNRPFCTVEAGRGGICGWIFLLPEILSRQLDDLKTYLKLPGWLLTSQYAVALTFLLSSIAGFSRSVFLDQAIVAFLFWNNLETVLPPAIVRLVASPLPFSLWITRKHLPSTVCALSRSCVDPQRWTLGRYSFLMLACIAGISFDLWWLRVYLNAWRLGSAEADMHDISKIFSIFLCCFALTPTRERAAFPPPLAFALVYIHVASGREVPRPLTVMNVPSSFPHLSTYILPLEYGTRVNSTGCVYVPGRPLDTSEISGYRETSQFAASAAAALPLMKASHDIAAGAPLFMVGVPCGCR